MQSSDENEDLPACEEQQEEEAQSEDTQIRGHFQYDYVALPFPTSYNEDAELNEKLRTRWRLIERTLRGEAIGPINDARSLERAIRHFNEPHSASWNLATLRQFCDGLNEEENRAFFTDLLPRIIQLALSLPRELAADDDATQQDRETTPPPPAVTPIRLLKVRRPISNTLTANQCATLLANAFFCTFPGRYEPRNKNRKFARLKLNAKLRAKRDRKAAAAATNDGDDATPAANNNVSAADDATETATKSATANESAAAPPEAMMSALTINSQSAAAAEDDSTGKTEQRFANYPSINFFDLLNGVVVYDNNDDATAAPRNNSVGKKASAKKPIKPPRRQQAKVEKLKCVFEYFRQITAPPHSPSRDDATPLTTSNDELQRRRRITFTRHVAAESTAFPDWLSSARHFKHIRVTSWGAGRIEDGPAAAVHIDFANRFVGGGVIGAGCVQEEIKFAVCPELICARLFTAVLQANEVLSVRGARCFSRHAGYGDDFVFAGPHTHAHTHADATGITPDTVTVAMDARNFSRNTIFQWESQNVFRELNKAITAFGQDFSEAQSMTQSISQLQSVTHSLTPSRHQNTIVTGNWGCGAFRGDKSLKSIIQLIACAHTNSNLIYYTFDDEELAENLRRIHRELAAPQCDVTVGQIIQWVLEYGKTHVIDAKNRTPQLYPFLFDRITAQNGGAGGAANT